MTRSELLHAAEVCVCGLCGLRRRAAEQTGGVRQMKRLTVDTDLSFCDIAQCDSIPGGSLCEDGRCDQRRCYEKLREYERSDLEPETLRKAQGLLKELKDARQTVELVDACGKRVCTSAEHWNCPYGNEGMTDCAVLLEAAYEDTIEKLLALKETLEG